MTALLVKDAARLTWQAGLTAFEKAVAAFGNCREDDGVDAATDVHLAAMMPLLLTPAPTPRR
jgi:hypothetical protein